MVTVSGTAAQRLESELKDAIVSMALRPGARLSEAEIAERHGVSRQPAREALMVLARTRLVQVMPQRGTFVSKISVPYMLQARFVREAVETSVVERACQAFDGLARERIDGLLDEQERFAAADDYDAFQRYDEMFHIALAEGAGCPLAWEALRDIKTHMDRVCRLTLPGPEKMLPIVGQHRDIVAAIDARDAPRAAAAMRTHLSLILSALPRIEAERAELFE